MSSAAEKLINQVVGTVQEIDYGNFRLGHGKAVDNFRTAINALRVMSKEAKSIGTRLLRGGVARDYISGAREPQDLTDEIVLAIETAIEDLQDAISRIKASPATDPDRDGMDW